MKPTGYFRSSVPPAGLRAVDTVFPFDGHDHIGARRAWEAAGEMARAAHGHVVAYQRPATRGPWDSAPEVGRWTPYSWELDDE